MLYLDDTKSNVPRSQREIIRQLVLGIITAHPDEIDCGECFELLDRFAEMTLSGVKAANVLPLVQDHLERCDDCREEFAALLAALYLPA
jgi:hypothetical protein